MPPKRPLEDNAINGKTIKKKHPRIGQTIKTANGLEVYKKGIVMAPMCTI